MMNNKFIKVCISLFVVLTLLLSLPIFVFGEDEVFIIYEGAYVKDSNIDSTGLVTGFNDFYFRFLVNPTSDIYDGMSIFVNSSGVVAEIYYFRLIDNVQQNVLVYDQNSDWLVPLTVYVIDDFGVSQIAESYFNNNYSFIDSYSFYAIFNSGYDGGYYEGYDEGYSEGLGESFQVGYDDGFEDGYEQGYENGDYDGYERGYDEGYDLGLENSGNFLTDLLGNVVSAVATVFEIEIIGNFALGDLLIGIFGVVFATLFLKFFAGG